MKFAALSSGSCGNCFYIREGNNAILVDAGISCKQVISRLNEMNEDPGKIKGIFLSHEHADHIKGVDVLARTFQIPVFGTAGTLGSEFICSQENLLNKIKEEETVKFGDIEISSFSKSHDAAEPVSFRIRNGKTISIITDIGYACKNVNEAVSDSDFLVMESNHDIEMLQNGPYPYFLKRRILGEKGHISNLHSSLCVLEHGSKKLKSVMLAHLSEKNNTENLAMSCFRNILKERKDLNPKILISERDVSSGLFRI